MTRVPATATSSVMTRVPVMPTIPVTTSVPMSSSAPVLSSDAAVRRSTSVCNSNVSSVVQGVSSITPLHGMYSYINLVA